MMTGGKQDGKGNEYRVGRRARVVYDDGIWYPAVITAHKPESAEPFTLTFDTGDTLETKLPDEDIRLLPDGPCAVCDKIDCFQDDLTVQCAACDLIVHQGCYGVRPFPSDNPWYCDLCKDDPGRPAKTRATTCVLCGKNGGAMKITADQKHHAHLACVIWIPEAHVVNTTDMSPVEIRHIPWQRQKLKCFICKVKDAPFDAPVQCYDANCVRSFHVGCARESGDDYYIAISESAEPLAYCPRHVPEEHRKPKEKRKKGRPPKGEADKDDVKIDPELEEQLKKVEDMRRIEQTKVDEARRKVQAHEFAALQAMGPMHRPYPGWPPLSHVPHPAMPLGHRPLMPPAAAPGGFPAAAAAAASQSQHPAGGAMAGGVGGAGAQTAAQALNAPGAGGNPAMRPGGAAGVLGGQAGGSIGGMGGMGGAGLAGHPGMAGRGGAGMGGVGMMGQVGGGGYGPGVWRPGGGAGFGGQGQSFASLLGGSVPMESEADRAKREQDAAVLRDHSAKLRDLMIEERRLRIEIQDAKRAARDQAKKEVEDAKREKREAKQRKQEEKERERGDREARQRNRDIPRGSSTRPARGGGEESTAGQPVAVFDESPLPPKPPSAFALFRDRVKDEIKLELQARTDEVNFSTEMSARWAALGQEEKAALYAEASKLMAEYQQMLEARLEEDRARREQMHSTTAGLKRNRTQTEFFELVRDDEPSKRARMDNNRVKRRMPRSWKAMALEAVVQLAPEWSSAASIDDIVARTSKNYPSFESKADTKVREKVEELIKEDLVHRFYPTVRTELDADDIEFREPKEDEEEEEEEDQVVMARLASEDEEEGKPEEGKGVQEEVVLYFAAAWAADILPEGEAAPSRSKEVCEAEDRAAHNAEMRQQSTLCDGYRAKFILSHWEQFAPFMPAAARVPDSSPLHAKLSQAERTLPPEGQRKGRKPVSRQPDCIVGGEMHPYQMEGLRWLVQQHDKGAGGILGDEMGLGKTLQVISLLGFLKAVRGEDGLHIVVAPLSVMNNWVQEIRRWCPTLKVVAFHGPQTERERIKKESLIMGKFDVMCTTYEMLVADIYTCQRFHWNYIVLDEAHRIKNEKTLMGQAVRRLRSSHRLLITGTPLQNNMHELWSLLNFLYPEVLSNADTFDKEWNRDGKSPVNEEEGEALKEEDAKDDDSRDVVLNEKLMAAAHELLRPLMLRRLKKDVVSFMQIPPKTETKIFVPLTEMQRFWYSRMLSFESATIAGSGQSDAYKRLNSLVMQLRKVCNHPFLLEEADTNPGWTDETIVHASGKMIVLDKLLRQLQAEGRKVLVFSQFTSMLDVLGDFMNFRRYKHLRLDGATSVARRRYEIACFQNAKSDYFVYLISTRAGGLGITLTAADTVVLYDSDWNPAIDAQAQDRAHRFGQTKPVSVFRFISRHTVEQRILQTAENKSCMNAMVMQDGGAEQDGMGGPKGMSMAEIVKMIEFGLKSITSGSSEGEMKELQESTIEEIVERAKQESEEEKRAMEREKAEAIEAANKAEEDEQGQQAALDKLVKGMSGLSSQQGSGGAKSAKEVQRSIADEWQSMAGTKRNVQSRTVKVNGHDVLRWSIEEEHKAEVTQKRATEAEEKRVEAKAAGKFKHQRGCILCHKADCQDQSGDHEQGDAQYDAPELQCVRCPTTMHVDCTPGWSVVQVRQDGGRKQAIGGWVCPHHRCRTCWRTAHEAGGLLFRCVSCPASLCEECLPEGFDPVPSHTVFGKLKYQVPRSFETIRCDQCAAAAERRERRGQHLREWLSKAPRWKKKHDPAGLRAMTVHFEEVFPVTMKFKLTIKAKGGKGKKAASASASVKEEEEEERVEVLCDGDWWKAAVLKREEGRVQVRYEGAGPEDDEWLEEGGGRLRSPQPEPVKLWSEADKQWVPAQINKTERGMVLVGPPGQLSGSGRKEVGEWMPGGSPMLWKEGEAARAETGPAPGELWGVTLENGSGGVAGEAKEKRKKEKRREKEQAEEGQNGAGKRAQEDGEVGKGQADKKRKVGERQGGEAEADGGEGRLALEEEEAERRRRKKEAKRARERERADGNEDSNPREEGGKERDAPAKDKAGRDEREKADKRARKEAKRLSKLGAGGGAEVNGGGAKEDGKARAAGKSDVSDLPPVPKRSSIAPPAADALPPIPKRPKE